MAIDDVSTVTRALVRLIREAVAIAPAWLPRPAPNVSPRPPDLLESEAIGFYLYHAREEAHTKGALPTSPGTPPIRFTPLGLSLHYLLTAKSELEASAGPYMEQLLVGCAMRALADYSVVDDTTEIGGVKILASAGIDGRENRFRLNLMPVPGEQALSYWTASSSPPRLSAYYQVSVVFLEPDHSRARVTRVQRFGIQTFVSGSPRLDTSTNILTINVPGEPSPRELVLRPAEVPYGSRFSVVGSDLGGDETRLVLRSKSWSEEVEVTNDWGVLARASEITAVAAELAAGHPVLPGIYGVRARVIRNRKNPDGSTRALAFTSNEVPITVSPRIDSIGAVSPTGVFTISGRVFAGAGLSAASVEVHVDGEPLKLGVSGSLAPGEYAVVDAGQLEVRLPVAAAAGVHALRVLVGGAEAPPQFLELS